MGVRNQREAITLETCLDLLTSGNLAGLGDVLIQRLKALEAAMADQNWQSARHLELIPPQSAPQRKGSGSQGGIQNAEAEDGHHQDEEQIGTRRRRVTQERAFRDAIERKGESKQWVGAPGHFQQGSGSDTGRTHRVPKERDAEPGPGESRRSERKVAKTEAKRSLVEEGETFSRPKEEETRRREA